MVDKNSQIIEEYVSKIMGSPQKKRIIDFLKSSSNTTSRLKELIGSKHISNVSRDLSYLKKHGIVERQGKIYKLTPLGEKIQEMISKMENDELLISNLIRDLTSAEMFTIWLIGNSEKCRKNKLFIELKRYDLVKYKIDVSILLNYLVGKNILVESSSGRSYRLNETYIDLYQLIDNLLKTHEKWLILKNKRSI